MGPNGYKSKSNERRHRQKMGRMSMEARTARKAARHKRRLARWAYRAKLKATALTEAINANLEQS